MWFRLMLVAHLCAVHALCELVLHTTRVVLGEPRAQLLCHVVRARWPRLKIAREHALDQLREARVQFGQARGCGRLLELLARAEQRPRGLAASSFIQHAAERKQIRARAEWLATQLLRRHVTR